MKVYLLILELLSVLLCRATPYTRILGGQPAPDGAYPYVASIRTSNNNPGFHMCGGSIIKSRTILTAAHCVDGYINDPPNLAVWVGTNYLSRGGTRYNVTGVKIHPDYIDYLLFFDVGLVFTERPILMGDWVQPIPIGELQVGGGAPVVLVGWGSTVFPGAPSDALQVINLMTLTFEDCRKLVQRPHMYFPSSLCTLTKFGEGACHGDSGSPLVIDGKVCGIVSWGEPCAKNIPDIFGRVSNFSSWILLNQV